MTRCASPTCQSEPPHAQLWHIGPLVKGGGTILLCGPCLALWCDAKGAKPRETTEVRR
jgi:hypothetical protein